MIIGIICAMDEETEYLLSKLSDYTTENIGEFVFYKGKTAEGREVVISRSGIGRAMSAADTALMINQFKADIIINSGIAGALGAGLKVNDIVFSTGALYHDADFTPFGYKLGQMPGQPEQFNADPELIAKADIAASTITELKDHIKKGLIVSGDQFINTPEDKKKILDSFPSAMATECEGAPIAHIAHSFSKPFIIIRSISDNADETETDVYDFNTKSAAQNSAKLVLSLIKLI